MPHRHVPQSLLSRTGVLVDGRHLDGRCRRPGRRADRRQARRRANGATMPAAPTAPASSPPRQITKRNVGQLQVAWTYPDGDTDFNPLVVRDVVYTRARGNALVALDAATGARALGLARDRGLRACAA